ncbi:MULTISPECIES: YrzI family small protein [Alteribacter]|uniref:YrzI family small protein n=1 Tax=Alteribacter keqinensis TaxID=2483800 RepID=A0A3M7TZ31_9BACI|nr:MULTISPECIES: YrzI family small protein [Alteribacter]MBM7097619.1 YrzI family small protein [Alteribacter salitolerans]RNA70162.1 YrzI family small protein [Alteribacter keqinensis]
MLLTLFHYTVSITRQPYSSEELEREQHYERACRRIEKQRARQAEFFRMM